MKRTPLDAREGCRRSDDGCARPAQWTGVAPATDVYTRGDTPTSEGTMTDMALTIGFTAGQDRVIYTSFHQEPGVDSATARLLQLLMFEL